MDRDPLRRDASLVFVSRYLKLSGHLAEAFGHVMDRLHRLHVCLEEHYLQVLRHRLIAHLAIAQVHTLPCSIAEPTAKERPNKALIAFHDCVGLIQLHRLTEELVDGSASLFARLPKIFIEDEEAVLRGLSRLQPRHEVAELAKIARLQDLCLELCHDFWVGCNAIAFGLFFRCLVHDCVDRVWLSGYRLVDVGFLPPLEISLRFEPNNITVLVDFVDDEV